MEKNCTYDSCKRLETSKCTTAERSMVPCQPVKKDRGRQRAVAEKVSELKVLIK